MRKYNLCVLLLVHAQLDVQAYINSLIYLTYRWN